MFFFCTFPLFIPFKSKRLHAMQIIRCKREMPQMEVAPQCTQKLYVGRKADWVLKFSCFFGFQESRGIGYSRYCVFKNFSRILEKFHFSISISKHFQFTFHSRFQGILISFSKRVNHIFISLLTSQKELIIFSFHFSLLGKSERDSFSFSLFTSLTFNNHSRRTP